MRRSCSVVALQGEQEVQRKSAEGMGRSQAQPVAKAAESSERP